MADGNGRQPRVKVKLHEDPEVKQHHQRRARSLGIPYANWMRLVSRAAMKLRNEEIVAMTDADAAKPVEE